VAVLQSLKARLHDDKLTIKDVQKLYKDEGLERVLRHVPVESLSPEVVEATVPEMFHQAEVGDPPRTARLGVELEMRLRLTLTGLLATKQRLDDILKRPTI